MIISQGYKFVSFHRQKQGSNFDNNFIIIPSSGLDRNHIRQWGFIYLMYNFMSTSTLLQVSYQRNIIIIILFFVALIKT